MTGTADPSQPSIGRSGRELEAFDTVSWDALMTIAAAIAPVRLSWALRRGKLATWPTGDVAARRSIVSPPGHRSEEARHTDPAVGAVAVSTMYLRGERTAPRVGCGTSTAADEWSTA